MLYGNLFSQFFNQLHQENCRVPQSVDKFALPRHFATLHSGFYSFSPIKAGMERSEMTDKPYRRKLVDGL